MKAYDAKKGNVVDHNGTVYQIRDIERSSPQGRGGNVKFRFTMYSVPGGSKFDLSLGGEDDLKEVELSRRQATFSYKDGDAFVFLDDEDYTPYTLDADVVGDAAGYIVDELSNCYVQIIDGVIWIRAARTIRPGQELTYHYNTDGEALIKCRCRPGCQTLL